MTTSAPHPQAPTRPSVADDPGADTSKFVMRLWVVEGEQGPVVVSSGFEPEAVVSRPDPTLTVAGGEAVQITFIVETPDWFLPPLSPSVRDQTAGPLLFDYASQIPAGQQLAGFRNPPGMTVEVSRDRRRAVLKFANRFQHYEAYSYSLEVRLIQDLHQDVYYALKSQDPTIIEDEFIGPPTLTHRTSAR